MGDAPLPVSFADVEAEPKAPKPTTTYCCGRLRSSHFCCGRYACTPKRKACCIAAVVLLVAGAIVAIVCGVYFGLYAGRVNLAVGALTGSPLSLAGLGHRRRSLLQTAGLLPTSAQPSATESAYAQVDALTLNVAYVRLASVSGGGHDLASTRWGASRSFVLRSGVNTEPLTATIDRAEPGDYFAADFVFWNRWSIQAFCRTANAFLYTTAAGVASLPATPSAMPSDYGPLSYDQMNGAAFTEGTDMASSTLAQGSMSFINSVYDYTVSPSSTVNLYLDSTAVVTCYDGTLSAAAASTRGQATGTTGLLYPMGMNVTYGANASPNAVTRVFDWAAPQFGFSSWTLPVFVEVADGGGAASSVGETYAFARNASWLPRAGAATDWSRVAIATVTWDGAGPDAALLDMRVRGGSSAFPAGFGVMGGFFGFAASPAPATGGVPGAVNQWAFGNGQQYYWSYKYIAERAFAGFQRTADFTTRGAVTVADGPLCNTATGGPPGTGMPNPCLGSVATFAYVQLPRST